MQLRTSGEKQAYYKKTGLVEVSVPHGPTHSGPLLLP